MMNFLNVFYCSFISILALLFIRITNTQYTKRATKGEFAFLMQTFSVIYKDAIAVSIVLTALISFICSISGHGIINLDILFFISTILIIFLNTLKDPELSKKS